MRILLVEDNPTNQFVALKMLEKLGYHADTAADGSEALAALGATAYDLVLMDCQMPELDGFETTRRIRADAASTLNPAVPIIAMTANAMEEDREKCFKAGMDDYISKPVDPAALAATLERWSSKVTGHGYSPEELKPERADSLIWDRPGFLVRVSNDEQLLKAVVREFLNDIPAQLNLLSAAAATMDRESIRQIAHRIKGASANVGGLRLQEVSARLQEEARRGTMESIRALARQAEDEFSRLRTVMTA